MRCIATLLMVVVVVVTEAVEGPLVDTEDGRVSGIVEKSVRGRAFYSFYGIPFAQPPLGKLRFKDPVTLPPWEGTHNASSHPAMCPQCIPDTVTGQHVLRGEEDCLYLNVFTPEVREGNSLPVMVFIHGGAFFAGGAAGYRPHALLDHHTVLVVLQYRLGVLGFLSTEDSVMPGNLGLKDQTMALQWVQRNIHHFGGDNTRITLFGESAGGASIHYQMLTPKAKGLFSRAILQSGTAMCPWAVNAKPREWAHQVADIVGCPADRGSQALLNCLQELDANVLALAHQKLWKWSTLPLTMVPWVDGEYLPAHPTKLVLEGRHTQVDIMSGVTRDEGALLALPAFSNKASLDQLNNNFSETGPITLELSNQHNEAEAVARQVYLHYLGTTHVTEAHAKELVRMFSDRYFGVCHDLATALHAANVHPAKKTFRYELEHPGQLSYSHLLCPSCDGEWVCHADDLLYLFYRGPFLTQPPGWPEDLERPEDLALRDIMTALWTNFAATGDPTPNDALGFKWEPSTADNLHYLSLTPSPSMKPDYRKETREFYNSLLLPENLILQTHLVDGTAGEPKAAGDSSKTEL